MLDDKTEIRSAEPNPNAADGALASSTPAVPNIELGAQLGRGGMAAVYEAQDLGFTPPRKVAIKFMDRAISADAEFRNRFEREAALVASFRHDNIVHVFASGEVEGSKYIVMEHLPGGTLAERLGRGAFKVPETIHIAAALASALAYSHDRGIIHRDLKPANVLFTSDGKPVLSDFGVAKSLANDTSVTRQVVVIGAPRYMAPEQAVGAPITDRADIYSLGLMIVEMLLAKAPPVGWRLGDTDLGKLLPGAPSELVDLTRRCLLANPASRPSAAECLNVLTSLRAPAPSRWRYAVVATILAGIVVAALYWWNGTRSASQPAPHAARLNMTRSPESTTVYLSDEEIGGDSVELRSGNEQLLAVAPGFYGEVRQVLSAPGSVQEIAIALQPVKLPTRKEYDRFEDLADRDVTPVITQAQVEEMGERTLQTALRLRLLEQTQDLGALEALNRELDALSRHGDARATVAALLGRSIRQEQVSQSSISGQLVAASERGDAMATFFRATAQRSGLSESDNAVSPVAFQNYCDQLALASAQGWDDVASKFSKLDGCK